MATDSPKPDATDGSSFAVPKLVQKPPSQTRAQSQIRTFLSVFTLERFKKNPDIYRKRISNMIDDQIRHAEATTALLRYLGPELRHQERQLGYLDIKCRTIYERLCTIRQLRESANTIIGSFDLSTGKSIEDAVEEAPSLLKDAVRLHQTRWRNAIASCKWQKDLKKAEEELASARDRFENNERELELKGIHIEMYKKILAIKDEFTGLSDDDTLKKIEGTLGVRIPVKEENDTQPTLKRSDSSVSSTSSDETNWDGFWESHPAMIESTAAQGAHLLDKY